MFPRSFAYYLAFILFQTTFFGAKDHLKLEEYRVFVNPSLSEVLCTTIVEALAMGKWVVCAKHPSNDFFAQFPNCLFFSNEEEFAANVYWALNHDPQPLTKEQRYALSWEAATERFLQASMITKDMLMKSNSFTDKFLAWMLEVVSANCGLVQFGWHRCRCCIYEFDDSP